MNIILVKLEVWIFLYTEFVILKSNRNKQRCLKLNLSVYFVSCLLLNFIAQFCSIDINFISSRHVYEINNAH